MESNKKKICLISPSLQMGGLERAMSNLGNYFNAKGYKVYYVVLYKFERFYTLDNGIELIEPGFRYNMSKPLYYLKLIGYIRKTVKSIGPDTVLSFGDYHNALVLFSLKGLKIPVYVSDRSSPDKDFGKILTMFKKWTYKSSAGIIAQTQRAADQKLKMLGKNINITIIPNTIREIKLYDIPRKDRILGVGRHHKVKGFDRLINAYALLDTPWQLVLAGGRGPETENLKQLVRDRNIEDKVVFLGEIKEIDKVYAEAGIFCLTSRSEGFPNALCEAMAAGLPGVSFDIVAGPADIITNGKNGILVQDGDIDGFARQLQTLISDMDYRRRLGNEASKLQDELSLELSGNKFLNFITSHL
jgi:GalNAc-alpha-(1->4)-GalNAc-alpha-(1->3)-diNAcBac-PP-undecaprenol alpha-1,4-N-acetyl-D-galactosaminyltransferase